MKILFVDDHPTNRKLGRALLEAEGHVVVEAADGVEALALLEGEKIDAIVSDILMPNLDGYRLCRAIRTDGRFCQLPFIFHTATYTSPGDEKFSLELGADRFLKKPATGTRIIAAIQEAVPAAKLRQPRPRTAPEELDLMRQYSERLVAKLEQKNLELERRTEGLDESENRFRQLAESITEVFWLADVVKSQMIYISPGYEKIWGRSCESLYSNPATWADSITSEDRARVLEAVRTKQEAGTYDEIYRIARPDGSRRWVRDRAFPVRNAAGQIYRIAGIAQDVTEQRSLEEQFRQAQKMEAVGQLAGGVAHDFNNILTVILGYAQMLLAENQTSPDSAEALTQILQAAERASKLTRQLLTFSRKQEIRPCRLDLNELVGDVGKMLRRLIGEHITLQVNHAPNLPQVLADAGMVEQVLLNLAVNARDAMPEGGQLMVTTETIRIDEAVARQIPDARAGDFVRLRVQDTGMGIPPEVLPHIFEPFFTTKDQGKGTGLGLATVYGIVQLHHGWIEVHSNLGEGAGFNIYLPAARPADLVAPVEKSAPQIRGGTETILLVEDEEALRGLAAVVLQRHGYRVLEAASGPAAVEVWKEHSPAIELLITDLVMPGGMSGIVLAEKLTAAKPSLKVIYSSGYSAEVSGRILDSKDGKRFLQKPYRRDDLIRLVREVLDHRG